MNKAWLYLLFFFLVMFVCLGVTAGGYWLYTTTGGSVEKAIGESIERIVTQNQIVVDSTETKILSQTDDSAWVAVFFYVKEGKNTYFLPLETIIEFNKINDKWVTYDTPILESPFETILFAASENTGGECVELNRLSLAPDEYPCVRVINRGNFDWEWDIAWFAVYGGTFGGTSPSSCPTPPIILKSKSTLDCFSPVMIESMRSSSEIRTLQLVAKKDLPEWQKRLFTDQPLIVGSFTLQ